MMSFKPIKNKIAVEIIEAEDKTAGGILLAPTSKDKPYKGKVINVGSEVENLKPGDVVYFSKYAGTEIKVNNKRCKVLIEKDILGVEE